MTTDRTADVADHDSVEDTLARLFAEVLQLPHAPAEGDFFDLGGSSVLVPRLVNRACEETGLPVQPADVFAAPTPAGLARRLEGRAGVEGRLAAGERRCEPPPVSYAQSRLWLHEQFHGPSPLYNVVLVFRLEGRIDAAALRLAVLDVMARHEALRTVFDEVAGRPVQRVLTMSAVGEPFTRESPTADSLESAVERVSRYSIDVEHEAPLRAWLFEPPDAEAVLALVVHHIACDGWSLERMIRDLAASYAARAGGTAPSWEPLPVRYTDFARWQRMLLGDETDPASEMATQLAYWRHTLRGVPAELALPRDRVRPAKPSFRGGIVEFPLDAALLDQLASLARACSATLFMVLHAGVVALLARLGAGTDIAIGTFVAGRTHEALDDLVGFFVNTTVVRSDLSASPTFRRLVAQVRESMLGALEHQDVPFDMVVEALRPPRVPGANPLFQVATVLDTATELPLRLPGVRVVPLTTPLAVAKFDLTFAFSVAGGGLTSQLRYATDLFDHDTVQAMGRGLEAVLRDMAVQPDALAGPPVAR